MPAAALVTKTGARHLWVKVVLHHPWSSWGKSGTPPLHFDQWEVCLLPVHTMLGLVPVMQVPVRASRCSRVKGVAYAHRLIYLVQIAH